MSGFNHLFTPPGHRGVDTSVLRSEALAPIVAGLRGQVLAVIVAAGARGLTSEEAADITGMDFGTAQPRTSDLKRLGLIRDSGQRRPNKRGNLSIVWVAVLIGGVA